MSILALPAILSRSSSPAAALTSSASPRSPSVAPPIALGFPSAQARVTRVQFLPGVAASFSRSATRPSLELHSLGVSDADSSVVRVEAAVGVEIVTLGNPLFFKDLQGGCPFIFGTDAPPLVLAQMPGEASIVRSVVRPVSPLVMSSAAAGSAPVAAGPGAEKSPSLGALGFSPSPLDSPRATALAYVPIPGRVDFSLPKINSAGYSPNVVLMPGQEVDACGQSGPAPNSVVRNAVLMSAYAPVCFLICRVSFPFFLFS